MASLYSLVVYNTDTIGQTQIVTTFRSLSVFVYVRGPICFKFKSVVLFLKLIAKFHWTVLNPPEQHLCRRSWDQTLSDYKNVVVAVYLRFIFPIILWQCPGHISSVLYTWTFFILWATYKLIYLAFMAVWVTWGVVYNATSSCIYTWIHELFAYPVFRVHSWKLINGGSPWWLKKRLH